MWKLEADDIVVKGGSSVKPAAATSGNDKSKMLSVSHMLGDVHE